MEIDMTEIHEKLVTAFSGIGARLQNIGILDVLEILLLAVLFYFLFDFMRQRRAGRLLVGIVALFVLGEIAVLCSFETLAFLFGALFHVGLLALIVIFQPEIRAALEGIGELPVRFFSRLFGSRNKFYIEEEVSILCDAVSDMSRSRTGALIVLERLTKLGDLMATGVSLDARLSVKMIKSIFHDRGPLHDGAVIIRHGRVAAASCVLPNSSRRDDEVLDVGTRHRAALGVSEISDAIVLVVSEETGTISLAMNGCLHRDCNVRDLRHELFSLLSGKTNAFGVKKG
jgi:diadenylate cyclase